MFQVGKHPQTFPYTIDDPWCHGPLPCSCGTGCCPHVAVSTSKHSATWRVLGVERSTGSWGSWETIIWTPHALSTGICKTLRYWLLQVTHTHTHIYIYTYTHIHHIMCIYTYHIIWYSFNYICIYIYIQMHIQSDLDLQISLVDHIINLLVLMSNFKYLSRKYTP